MADGSCAGDKRTFFFSLLLKFHALNSENSHLTKYMVLHFLETHHILG